METDIEPTSVIAPLRRIADLPGPRGIPLLGNALQVSLPRMHLDIEKWAREYGPYFRLRFGRIKMLVIADHEAISKMLRDRPDGFRRPVRLENVSKELNAAQGVFTAEGESWKSQRRMIMSSFSPGNVKAYFPALQKVVMRLQKRWQSAQRSGAPIDLQADLKRYTVDIIAGLAFGIEVNTLEQDGDPLQRDLDTVMAGVYRRSMSSVPYWRWLRLPQERRLERSVVAVRLAINGFIAAARKRMEEAPTLYTQPNNLLEAMIAAADQPDSGLNDRHVAGNVSNMLLAGEDTTANTLGWMIYLLKRNPDVLRRAQEEVRRIAPDPTAFTPAQMGGLDYLEACAQETMRLKPVAPFQTLEALRDTTVAGIQVPAGTLLWCVMRHDSIDGRFLANAAGFDPQRWLDDQPEAATARRVSTPFGAGPRICPGRYLALLEIKMAMAMLLACFDIERVDTANGPEAQERMAFTMNPVGLRMWLAGG